MVEPRPIGEALTAFCVNAEAIALSVTTNIAVRQWTTLKCIDVWHMSFGAPQTMSTGRRCVLRAVMDYRIRRSSAMQHVHNDAGVVDRVRKRRRPKCGPYPRIGLETHFQRGSVSSMMILPRARPRHDLPGPGAMRGIHTRNETRPGLTSHGKHRGSRQFWNRRADVSGLHVMVLIQVRLIVSSGVLTIDTTRVSTSQLARTVGGPKDPTNEIEYPS
jgi:hypothetical protein